VVIILNNCIAINGEGVYAGVGLAELFLIGNILMP
jgi:hypothetical protein